MEPGAETGPVPGGELSERERAAGEAEQRSEIERLRAEIEALQNRIAELEALAAERRELRRLLVEAEQRIAELPDLRRKAAEHERVISSAEWRIATALAVPGRRAEGMWLPAIRRRVKRVLGWLARQSRSS
jgi:predicted nuclease with TOPRIM domain